MSEGQHEHVFYRADLRHTDGSAIPDGRRCSCGMEVVGSGPLAVNAGLVRAGRKFNRTLAEAMGRLAAASESQRRRRFPDSTRPPGGER